MKYVMLILDTEAARALDPAERDAWMSEIMAWYEKTGANGQLADSGHQLATPDTAKTVRANGVFDGPFIEAKEVLGGYSVLEADTIEEAVEIAESWPGVGRGWITMEIRPIIEMD